MSILESFWREIFTNVVTWVMVNPVAATTLCGVLGVFWFCKMNPMTWRDDETQ